MKDADAIRALSKIFAAKKWFPKDDDTMVFDNFCDLIGVLEPPERELLLELTDRYLWITGDEYQGLLREALKMVPSHVLSPIKKLFLFPIIKPSDEGKAKSGIALVYDIIAMLPTITTYKDLSPIPLATFEAFSKSPGRKKTELIYFVDDFIGTGDTLNQCLEEISKKMTIDYNRLIIVAISCQKDVYEKLTSKGIMVVTKYVTGKGITDHNIHPAIEEKKALMRTIEKSIPGAAHFSLGWQESEAVITLKKTPDNTFPIFWKKLKRDGKLFKAPFLRN